DRNELEALSTLRGEFGEPFAIGAVEDQHRVASNKAQDIAQIVHLPFRRFDRDPLGYGRLAIKTLHALPLAHSRSMRERRGDVKYAGSSSESANIPKGERKICCLHSTNPRESR